MFSIWNTLLSMIGPKNQIRTRSGDGSFREKLGVDFIFRSSIQGLQLTTKYFMYYKLTVQRVPNRKHSLFEYECLQIRLGH